jgi:predicted translin family RNA/ssDNA-binding protein
MSQKVNKDKFIVDEWLTTYNEMKMANLRTRFDYLTRDVDNWKMPFGSVIPAKHYDEYNEAAEFYTGASLEITRRYKEYGVQYLDVYCEGYYNTIGA